MSDVRTHPRRAFAFRMPMQDEWPLTVAVPDPTRDDPDNVVYADLSADEARVFLNEVRRALTAPFSDSQRGERRGDT